MPHRDIQKVMEPTHQLRFIYIVYRLLSVVYHGPAPANCVSDVKAALFGKDTGKQIDYDTFFSALLAGQGENRVLLYSYTETFMPFSFLHIYALADVYLSTFS